MSLFSFITDINRFCGVNVRTAKNKQMLWNYFVQGFRKKQSNLWEIYVQEKLLKIQMIFIPVTSNAQ